MESSASDDDGPAGPSSNYRIAILFLLFTFTCFRPGYDTGGAFLAMPALWAAEKPVEPPPLVKKPVKKKKKIYLTFDDGPNKGTQNVLDIVQQEQVPATFFIVGEHVFASLEQARTWDSLQHAENIEICNHSYTHAHNRYEKFYQYPDSVVKDIEKTQDKLLPENIIVRAPGRNSWRIDSLQYTDIKKSRAAMDSLQSAGFVVMGWDLEWHYDPKTMVVQNNADELLNQVDSVFAKGKTKTTDHLVLLAHDQVYHKAADSTELRTFVQKLKLKEDYELMLVSSYPGADRIIVDTLRLK
jgi:peptidoglycan-N-acetylglucosamine deacetylase